MFTMTALRDLETITAEERWSDLLPQLFRMLSCSINIQAQAFKLFEANLDLLLGLRRSAKHIMISPTLVCGRGVIDYVVDDIIVELKTSEGVQASHVCQVALYTLAAAHAGVFDPATRRNRDIPKATPALHFARFGTIAKIPMPTVSIDKVYPIIMLQPISSLARNQQWLETVFDMGEVQVMCADLEAYLTSRGMKAPAESLTPPEMGVLGTLADTIIKIVLANDFPRIRPLVYTELTRVDVQLRRLHNVPAVDD